MKLIRILPFLVFLISAAPSAAQQPGDRLNVAVATLKALLADDQLPTGNVGILSTGGMSDVVPAAARLVNGHVTTGEKSLRCGKLPSSCDIVDAAVLIELEKVRISQDQAEVEAVVWWETGIVRIPVAVKTVTVKLSRKADGWVVTDQQVGAIT